MTGPSNRVATAETEAAEWHSRLGARSVTSETVTAFFAWRQAPGNADAYRRVERIWGETPKLAGEPAMQRALDDALSRRSGASSRPPRVLMALAAVGVASAVIFGVLAWLETRNVYVTGVGEARVVQLADGSSVHLDTDSRIHVRFDGGERLIELENGQALFTVAHDAARPFVVRAGEARVTAVGTVFEVQRKGEGAKVILVSGVVDIASGKEDRNSSRMTAGQQARITSAGAVTRPADVDVETSWTEGRIVFRDTPLKDAVDEVNRYLTGKVELVGVDRANEPVNGVFRTGDRDAFVSASQAVYDLDATTTPDGSVRLSPRRK